jgi:hypothetical protein
MDDRRNNNNIHRNSNGTNNKLMWEGYGGPVHMDRPDFSGIDPTLQDCC